MHGLVGSIAPRHRDLQYPTTPSLPSPLVDTSPSPKKHNLTVFPDFSSLDKDRISGLVSKSFCGRSLVPGYFDSPVAAVILESDYRGLAVLKKLGPKGLWYLDKIATDPTMHGTGLGSALFQAACNTTGDSVSWRAAKTNSANPWYSRLGMQVETDEWFVYLRNAKPSDMSNIVDSIIALPRTVI